MVLPEKPAHRSRPYRQHERGVIERSLRSSLLRYISYTSLLATRSRQTAPSLSIGESITGCRRVREKLELKRFKSASRGPRFFSRDTLGLCESVTVNKFFK